MLTLVTGLPGNGKTLYALTWLRQRAKQEKRTVYYSGITDCMIPGWVEFEADQWDELPSRAMIVIDEAQRAFRPRVHGTKVPVYVEALETHRHKGYDIVLITQHPMLVESNVRRLVGQHFHVIRKFGTAFATVHEWNKCKETCDKSREDSIRHEFRFPKEVFALYKSAEAHTHKVRIPVKVFALLALLVGVPSVAFWWWQERASTPSASASGSAGRSADSPPRGSGSAAPLGGVRPEAGLTAAQYAEQHAARVPGLAYTAPVYDAITTATEAPYPAACVTAVERCQCYSQQATRLDVPKDLCVRIAAGGFFVSWRQHTQQQQQQQQQRHEQHQPLLDAENNGSGLRAPALAASFGYNAGDARTRSVRTPATELMR